VETSAASSAKIEAAKAGGIRFIQLQSTDIIGHIKVVAIPIHQLDGSVAESDHYVEAKRAERLF